MQHRLDDRSLLSRCVRIAQVGGDAGRMQPARGVEERERQRLPHRDKVRQVAQSVRKFVGPGQRARVPGVTDVRDRDKVVESQVAEILLERRCPCQLLLIAGEYRTERHVHPHVECADCAGEDAEDEADQNERAAARQRVVDTTGAYATRDSCR